MIISFSSTRYTLHKFLRFRQTSAHKWFTSSHKITKAFWFVTPFSPCIRPIRWAMPTPLSLLSP